jgi:hypothetical protein
MAMNQLLYTLPRGSGFHALDAFASEGQKQQAACRRFVDAARLQVKKCVLFDLANRRPVSALDIIGVDLELRLGVNLCVIGKQQVAIRLLGVGLLRVFVHYNAPVKDAMRMSIQNAVIELAAAAMRTGVLDMHVVVEMLPSISNKEAVDQALAAFSAKDGMHIVANQSTPQEH